MGMDNQIILMEISIKLNKYRYIGYFKNDLKSG